MSLSNVKISFHPKKKGAHLVWVKGAQRVKLEELVIPFGPQSSKKNKKVSLNAVKVQPDERMSLDYNVTDAETVKQIQAIDQGILDTAQKYSLEWFGKTHTLPELKKLYIPLLKDPVEAKYSPKLHTKVNTNAAIFKDGGGKSVTCKFSEMQPKSTVIPVVQPLYVYLMEDGRFGLTIDTIAVKMVTSSADAKVAELAAMFDM